MCVRGTQTLERHDSQYFAWPVVVNSLCSTHVVPLARLKGHELSQVNIPWVLPSKIMSHFTIAFEISQERLIIVIYMIFHGSAQSLYLSSIFWVVLGKISMDEKHLPHLSICWPLSAPLSKACDADVSNPLQNKDSKTTSSVLLVCIGKVWDLADILHGLRCVVLTFDGEMTSNTRESRKDEILFSKRLNARMSTSSIVHVQLGPST